jgi:hypothetical protein
LEKDASLSKRPNNEGEVLRRTRRRTQEVGGLYTRYAVFLDSLFGLSTVSTEE